MCGVGCAFVLCVVCVVVLGLWFVVCCACRLGHAAVVQRTICKMFRQTCFSSGALSRGVVFQSQCCARLCLYQKWTVFHQHTGKIGYEGFDTRVKKFVLYFWSRGTVFTLGETAPLE